MSSHRLLTDYFSHCVFILHAFTSKDVLLTVQYIMPLGRFGRFGSKIFSTSYAVWCRARYGYR